MKRDLVLFYQYYSTTAQRSYTYLVVCRVNGEIRRAGQLEKAGDMSSIVIQIQLHDGNALYLKLKLNERGVCADNGSREGKECQVRVEGARFEIGRVKEGHEAGACRTQAGRSSWREAADNDLNQNFDAEYLNRWHRPGVGVRIRVERGGALLRTCCLGDLDAFRQVLCSMRVVGCNSPATFMLLSLCFHDRRTPFARNCA